MSEKTQECCADQVSPRAEITSQDLLRELMKAEIRHLRVLWQTAVELARLHGVYSVAHPLRLDYTGLKKRLGGIPVLRRKAKKPAFVELVAPQEECVIEFEAPSGNKMRVQWKASSPCDWVSLLRAWRDAEG
jgi:hypothetical protein